MNVVRETVEIIEQNPSFAECCDLLNKHSLCEERAKVGAEEERNKKTGSQMLEVWQMHIFKQDRFGPSTLGREMLVLFLKKYFKSSLKEWKKFVFYITKSKYLMGKTATFRVSLDWLMCELNLLNVKKGLYHSLEEKREYRVCRGNFK